MLQKTFKPIVAILLLCIFASCNNDDDTVITPDPATDTTYELLVENDVAIPMRDKVELSANVYRPDATGKFPVIMSLGPYGKDELPAEYDPEEDGDISVSEHAAFELPDPAYWVKQGYVVIAVDSRGMGKSEGKTNLFEQAEAEDYYDAIEWAGTQTWSSGNVGLNGVSYYGLSQWRVAAMNPPHLKAIIPWEALTDLYRDATHHGGIPSTFIDGWFQYNILANLSNKGEGYRDIQSEINTSKLASASIFDELSALSILPQVKVPAYVAVSIQDHGLHTRGTLIGFERIGSQNKWLELHGRKKWEYYYSKSSLERQKMFFDQFLKAENSGIMEQPRVQYELRESYYNGLIKTANSWPVPNRTLRKLYLNSQTMTIDTEQHKDEGTTLYDATILGQPAQISNQQKAVFRHTFANETDIVGSIKLNVFVSTDEADDIDLFVGIQKEDEAGNPVYFQGPEDGQGQVATGWLRVSHRALDMAQSTDEMPYHQHGRESKIAPNEIVEVQVEIWPTTTRYKQGEQLVLVIQGNDIEAAQSTHKNLINRGNTTIHTGGKYNSYLQIPVL